MKIAVISDIHGNHERQLLGVWDGEAGAIDPLSSDGYAATKIGAAHARWMRAIPAFHWLMPDVLLVHGTPGSDLQYWMETVTADFGQHGSRAMRCGGTLVVNPGSVGLQAYEDGHPHKHCVENGSPHARYAIVERRPLGWHVQQHAVPYDWEAQARVAAEHARPDWAHALRTGRMAPAHATIAQ